MPVKFVYNEKKSDYWEFSEGFAILGESELSIK